uniref:Uncharacterized protein n=1 Tax=Vitis vinifera TaxID=29760 RepID=A5ALA0_VITVI|nr:hypothetical protein VITISV_011996 [Vitis vinifera]
MEFLLKLPDICATLEAEHLKMKANFAALRVYLVDVKIFRSLLECLRNLADTIFSCEMPTLGKLLDSKETSISYLLRAFEGKSKVKDHLELQVLGERYEPLQGASVINFVDYSLNQGAPAGHESAETPIGHESNGAVAGDQTSNQMVPLPLPLLGTNQHHPIIVLLTSSTDWLNCLCL